MPQKLLAVTMILVMTFVSSYAYGRSEGSLYSAFEKKKVIKTYVAKITDSGSNKKADLADLKSKIEEALQNRKSLNFDLVSNPADADIVIEMNVKEFLWLEEDPLDHVTGVAPAAWDAINKDNYARLQVNCTVKDAATGDTLWQNTLKSTVTETVMSEDESIPLVNDHFVKVFIRKCFGKKKQIKGYGNR
jgi:hypothetical protein